MKSLKALNHEGHKGKEKLFFVLFVSFVVPFFSGLFVTIFLINVSAPEILPALIAGNLSIRLRLTIFQD